MTTTEWIKPESLSTPVWTYRFAGLRIHSKRPLVALLGLVHLWITLPLFVLWPPGHYSGCSLIQMELEAAIKVTSTIVTWRIVIPRSLR